MTREEAARINGKLGGRRLPYTPEERIARRKEARRAFDRKRKEAKTEYERKRRAQNMAKGLNSRGKERQRAPCGSLRAAITASIPRPAQANEATVPSGAYEAYIAAGGYVEVIPTTWAPPTHYGRSMAPTRDGARGMAGSGM